MAPRHLPIAALLVAAALSPARAQEAAPRFERFTLENGLRVTLRPVEGAKQAAVVVLFDFGENADPAGKSGLAHLCEHLYCTAAAGETKARTAEEWMRERSGGCNAQTGWDYTVLADVVAAEGLEAALKDAAARLGALRPTREDLDRERPRLLAEVESMFGGPPALAAQNHARAALFRRPGRRGGLPAEVRALSLEDVVTTLARLYRPCNARLVVAGAVDAAATRKSVEALFGGIPRGEAPTFASRSDPRAEGTAANAPVASVAAGAGAAGSGAHASAGWLAPLPGGSEGTVAPGYAEFLVLATRLWTRSARRERVAAARPQVIFAPLDDPDFLLVTAEPIGMESDAEAVQRIESFVAEAAATPLAPGEGAAAKFQMANFLGTATVPDALLAVNPYLAAFSLGRREQLGLRGRALSTALEGVTEESFRKFVAGFLPRRAAVVVRPAR